MRWNDLFADLEGQLGAAADAQFTADVADRTRGERASVPLESRLAAAVGAHVSVTVSDGERVRGVLSEVAATWVLVNETGRQSLIPTGGIVAVGGLPVRAIGLSVVARRLSIGHALRALSRDRAEVVLATVTEQQSGVIVQVGADYAELGDRQSHTTTVIPFTSMVRVTSVGVVRA